MPRGSTGRWDRGSRSSTRFILDQKRLRRLEYGRPCSGMIWIRRGPPAGGGELFVRDHFAEVGDVLLDSGDLLRPGNQALVRYSGSVLSFGFGKRFECVLQLLVKRGAIHMRR